jgi:hypothetical protein
VLGAQWKNVEVNKIRDKVKSGGAIPDSGCWNNSYIKANVLAKWWNTEKENYMRDLRVEACNASWEYKNVPGFKGILLMVEYKKRVG